MRVNHRTQLRSLTDQLALAVVAVSLLFSGARRRRLSTSTAPPPALTRITCRRAIRTMRRRRALRRQRPPRRPMRRAASAASTSAGSNEALIVENLNLGHREAALNRLDQAEAYYRRVLELQPDNSVANHRLAVIADKKHDYARAEHYYLTALQREPRNPDLLSDVGYSYLLQGRREDSERCLMAATRLDPSHAKALHNLSLLYAANGDYDRAFDALRRAARRERGARPDRPALPQR